MAHSSSRAAADVEGAPKFLEGGGEMGALMRRRDWSGSPLGEPDGWPQSLRTAVGMMLDTLQPMFIAWGPQLAFLYNDAYAPVLGHRHLQALGIPFAQIWADIWADLSPLIDEALSGRAVWQEDLPLLMHRHGYPEQTYFTFTYSPLRGDDGQIAGMFCTCIETTGRVSAERALRETAEALAASEARYRRQGERLFSLFDEAPGFVAVLEGPEHVFTLTNQAYLQLLGHRDLIGQPVREAVPEAGPSGLFEVLDRVYTTGEAFRGVGVRVPLQRSRDTPPQDRFVDFIYQPIRDEEGRVTGIFVQGSDVTEREVFLEKQQLLLNELNHRVKNNLATVQSLATQTARQSKDVQTFVGDFQGRLSALARTHDALTARAWSGADLEEIVKGELRPFADRVRLKGPLIELDSGQALALGMIVHELTTNAAKYGALSGSGGTVEVSWGKAPRGGRFLRWREGGGPAVQPPTRTGFGSRLMAKLASGDMGGALQIEFDPSGLQARLEWRRSTER